MGRKERLALFGEAADGFFAGVDWLAAPVGLPGLGLSVAAAFTRLLIDQADARFDAVIEQPIGVLPSGYDMPGPDEIFDWFRFEPDPPEIRAQFAPEIAAGDWEALQRVHRILHEVHVLKRPLLRRVFRDALDRKDYRAVVAGYDAAKAETEKLLGNAALREAFADFFSLLTGDGPERNSAQAKAQLAAHWAGIRDLVVEELT